MKKHTRHILWAVAIVAAVTACFQLSEVIIPTGVKTNSTAEVIVRGSIKPQTAYGPEGIAIAMLVPRAWDVTNTAEVTLSSQNLEKAYGVKDPVDEKMVPISNVLMPKTTGTEGLEIYTGLTWSQAYYMRYGDMGNVGGDMEWVIFTNESTKLTVQDLSGADYRVELEVKIKFKTGEDPIRCILAFEFAGEIEGWEGVGFKNNMKTGTIVVGDGSTDYTAYPLTSTVPTSFRYGDFFCVQFTSEAGGMKNALYGERDVYMCGTVYLADGTTVTLDRKDETTRMNNVSNTLYSRYIFPRHYFGLDRKAEITNLYLYFTNKDGSKVVKPAGADLGFRFKQSNK
ncbi:MAG: DUF4961 domain-containing protein [Bacteroidales bacterium]|nr:DUF4961 domain-containing protein [Bacteroidales bacterium]